MSIDFLLMFSQIYYILGRKSIDMNKVQFISQQGVPKSSENKASFSPYLLISWHIYTQTNSLDSLETEVLARKKEDGVFLGTPQLFSYWWRWHLSCQIVFFLLIKFFQASISISICSLSFTHCTHFAASWMPHPESHFFAFAYAVLIGKPLPFILWWVPAHFLGCGSGVWEAVADHCLHWVGCPFSVLLGYHVSTSTWDLVSCTGAITCLSYQTVWSLSTGIVFLTLCLQHLAGTINNHES